MIIEWGNTRKYPQYTSPAAAILYHVFGGLTGASPPSLFFRGYSYVARLLNDRSVVSRIFTGESEVSRCLIVEDRHG